MPKPIDYIEEVSAIVGELGRLGLDPVLVGGMALVILGSRRVTRDFDFVIAKPEEQLKKLVGIFYGRGFELATQLNDAGEITATIDNQNVAAIRLKVDAPDSAFFLNPKTGLRIDLLFDFPIPVSELTEGATVMKIRSHSIPVAAPKDLLRLKEMAHAARAAPGDAGDIGFLKAWQK